LGTRSAADALLQTIELAQAAGEIGVDGAFVRVHHWERQLASLQSSTLMSEDTGIPFGELQAEQIRLYREARAEQGRDREPRVSVSRSVLPISEDIDRLYFGDQGHDDQVGLLGGVRSRFGKTYVGEPDKIAAGLAADEAVRTADTVLFPVPNQLGVEYNARILDTIARHIAPAIGWTAAGAAAAS